MALGRVEVLSNFACLESISGMDISVNCKRKSLERENRGSVN